MKTILTANDYDVLVARDGEQALMMVNSHCPDMIILDLGLPDMDGLKIIKAVREWSQVPIIVVSARSREQDKVMALDLGADDYVTKPFGTSELLAEGTHRNPPYYRAIRQRRGNAGWGVPGGRPEHRL